MARDFGIVKGRAKALTRHFEWNRPTVFLPPRCCEVVGLWREKSLLLLLLHGPAGANPKRDFSLRKPTSSQEANWEEKASACSVRNDGAAGCRKKERRMASKRAVISSSCSPRRFSIWRSLRARWCCRKMNFDAEFLALLKKRGVEFDPRFVFG
jgi:hypothetical protein